MSELEQRLQELEETIYKTEDAFKRGKVMMPQGKGEDVTCYPYVYIIGVLIPIITIAALYFSQPKWVQKKEKGKYIIDWQNLLKWVVIITVISWVGLYLINYCGGFNKLQACFSKLI